MIYKQFDILLTNLSSGEKFLLNFGAGAVCEFNTAIYSLLIREEVEI
jgi:hypothetical protein